MGTLVGSLASALHMGGGVNPLYLCSGYQSVWAWENEGIEVNSVPEHEMLRR